MSKMMDKLYEWYLEEECKKADTKEIAQAVERYEATLEKIFQEKSKNESELWESVCSYGEERERKGFKDGFRMALELINI